MSKYLRIQDQLEAHYIVIVVHDEYEQSVMLFATEEAARKEYKNWSSGAEIYLTKIIS